MKKSIICLLMLLSLCLCFVFASCGKEDTIIPAPDGGDIGKGGEVEIYDKVEGDVNLAEPNDAVPGSTPRY